LLTTAAVLPLVAEARSQSAQVWWLRPPDSGVVGELATFVAALAGKTATVLGDPDQPHIYTYIPDIGEGLAVLGEHRMCPAVKSDAPGSVAPGSCNCGCHKRAV
jgi:hypothetical protein